MNSKELILGICIGIATTFIGMLLFLKIFTNYNLFTDFNILKAAGLLGKVTTLGAILNLIVFYILLKKNKDTMAKGIILATIILTISTLFV